MAATFTILRATAVDVEHLLPLFEGYRAFYKAAPNAAGSRAFLAARLGRAESVVFLARAGDAAAGFAQLYPTFSSVSISGRWILNDLFVDPAFRGLGIGRALTERCMAHCRETGALGLMLLTESTNSTAQKLYESLGWTRDTVYWRYTWKV